MKGHLFFFGHLHAPRFFLFPNQIYLSVFLYHLLFLSVTVTSSRYSTPTRLPNWSHPTSYAPVKKPKTPRKMVDLKAGSRPPWVGLGAAVWVQIASGNSYTFPLYSASLKTILGYSQQQLTILGVANDIGENVGILPGIASNKLPPWVVLSIGVCFCFLGYGVLWLAVSQTVQSLPYWLVSILLILGASLFTLATLVRVMVYAHIGFHLDDQNCIFCTNSFVRRPCVN